jgi:hypothetical protein
MLNNSWHNFREPCIYPCCSHIHWQKSQDIVYVSLDGKHSLAKLSGHHAESLGVKRILAELAGYYFSIH